MDPKMHDRMRNRKPTGAGNRKTEKKLLARQRAFDALSNKQGKTRPGSRNPKK